MDHKKIILNKICSEKSIELFTKLKITSLILFGSYNTDEYTAESDVDIAIIGENKIDLDDILELELYFETILNKEIDIIDLKSDNIDLFVKINILNSGTVLYSSDDNFNYEAYAQQVDWTYRENRNYMFFRRRDVLL